MNPNVNIGDLYTVEEGGKSTCPPRGPMESMMHNFTLNPPAWTYCILAAKSLNFEIEFLDF